MPQVILSVPQEKLPILHDFINALGIDTTNPAMFNNSIDTDTETESNTFSSFFKTYFGWEYFCNELEFE